MNTEPIGTALIERYLRTRRLRYFRGRHDGEYFFILTVDRERLHVHLESTCGHLEMFTIRVTPACFFPIEHRGWLMRFADQWNRNNQWAKAVLHGSSDPNRIGVVAENSYPLAETIRFNNFASFVDHTIASAIELFGEILPAALAHEPWLRDAG
jgi:hypothetical protein